MIAAVRLAAVAVTTAVGVALALAAQASPASAAEQQVGALISLDGVTFAETPAGSLFPGGTVLIPGGTADTTLWVRNATASPAELRIAIADATSTTAAFLESLTLQATAATSAGSPVPLGADGDCVPLLTGEVLAPGATAEVHLVLALDEAADNAGQGSVADAQLAVSLADASAGVSLAPNCDTASGVPLLPGSSGSGSATSSNSAGPSTDSAVQAAGNPSAAGGGSAGDPTASALPDHAEDLTLPTLPFGDSANLFPALLAAALLLGAGGVGTALLIRKRRENA